MATLNHRVEREYPLRDRRADIFDRHRKLIVEAKAYNDDVIALGAIMQALLSTHKTPAVMRWLGAHPRFHLHATPTSSSWLNQVERWFGLLTDKQLRRGVHKNLQALEKDIRTWVGTCNENPRPFAWTKTADEIFERLNAYLQRIPGAGH